MRFSNNTIRDNKAVIVRGIVTYFLCLAAFYFYDRSTAGGAETRELGIVPYVVISVWFSWIFFHNRILLRKLAFRKKILIYAISVSSGIVAISAIQQQIVRAIKGTSNPLISIIPGILFYTFVGSVIFLAFEYLRNRRDFHQLNTLKKEVELQRLKVQLNPHFLFNALNNIYSYNLENNKYGNDLILKLGQLMRFIIESSQRESVTLRDDVLFIENYIAFERERLGDRCHITYVKDLSAEGKSVPPLLLFPFIENAFKHGTKSIEPAQIYIKLEDTDEVLSLTVKNQITDQAVISTGTGHTNTVRRLQLALPDKHHLEVKSDANQYIVKLKISL